MNFITRLFSKSKKIKVGDWVTSSKNLYGTWLHCQVVRIYYRKRQYDGGDRYCKLQFELDGQLKTINVTYKSCRPI